MPSRSGLWACLLVLSAISAAPRASATVLVLDPSSLDLTHRQLAASLQGIVNRSPSGPRVFVADSPGSAAWLDHALLSSPQPRQSVSLDGLLEAARPYLRGQVLYDQTAPYTLDVATTAAGLRDAALTTQDLGLPTLYDFRRRWSSADEAYRWAASSLLPQASRAQLAVLPAGSFALRDYAIQQRMFVFGPPAGTVSGALNEVLSRFAPGTLVFGERSAELLPVLAQYALPFVSASGAANLSFYSSLPGERQCYQYPGHLEAVAPRYLALILDCSELDFALQQMSGIWDQPERGSLPLGWALPGALATAAPPIAHRYYADAYRSGVDQFVLGPSGVGEIATAQAASPEALYRGTSQAAGLLDAHTALYLTSPGEDIGTAVTRLADEAHLRGVFLLTRYDQPPALYSGAPALATPRVDSVAQAITYLDRLPLDRRFVAICLDAHTLGPADAAHIAAHVSSRYVVVPPAELMALIPAASVPAQQGPPAAKIASAEYPEGVIDPGLPVPVRIGIAPAEEVLSASIVYRPAGTRFALDQPLQPADGGFRTSLPPLRWGGIVEVKARVTDTQGRSAWSPLWTLDVARQDTDGDGLSDAEEAFLLTDPHRVDTDGDGLTDLNDPHPTVFDRDPSHYLWPIAPASDPPYLTDPGKSQVVDTARVLSPGQSVEYYLPTERLPAGASACVVLAAQGAAAISIGPEPGRLVSQFSGEIPGQWHSAALSSADYPNNVYLQIACPQGAAAPLSLSSLGLQSPWEAPSITQVRCDPPSPGPDQPITVSALIYSPAGVAGADLIYRVNGRGRVTLPMIAQGQRYVAALPALANRDQLEYWIVARDPAGNAHATPSTVVWVGGRGREIVSLLARRQFVGDWRPGPEWEGAAAFAPQAGAQDVAPVNVTGGTYTVWVLAGGRGNGLVVSADGKRVGAIAPSHPDGWQNVGRVRLEAGRHRVMVSAVAVAPDETWSAPRYAAVVLSTDTLFAPPPQQVFDVVNSLVLLSPDTREPLSGLVELRATGAGNLIAVEFSVDDEAPRRVSGPPFRLSLSTSRYANGPHVLRLEAVDRTGPTGLILEVPVTITNP